MTVFDSSKAPDDFKESKELTNGKTPVTSDGEVESDKLIAEVDNLNAGKTTGDEGVGGSKAEPTDISQAPAGSEEISENKSDSADKEQAFGDDVKGDEVLNSIKTAESPEISVETAKIDSEAMEKAAGVTTAHNKEDKVDGDTLTKLIDSSNAPGNSKESSGPALKEKEPITSGDEDTLITEMDNSNPIKENNEGLGVSKSEANTEVKTENEVKDLVKEPLSGDEIKKDESESIPTSKATQISGQSTGVDIVKTPNESDLTVATDEKLTIPDSSKQHTDHSTQTTNTLKTDNDIPKELFHKNGQGSATETSNSLKTDSDKRSDIPKELFIPDDRIYFKNDAENDCVHQHESDLYDFDDSDESPFDEPCDCETINGMEKNRINSLRPEQTEYFTRYGDVVGNHHHSADKIEYSPHTYDHPYDHSKHFNFYDDFDPVKDLDELFGTDFNDQRREQSTLFDDFD